MSTALEVVMGVPVVFAAIVIAVTGLTRIGDWLDSKFD
jgi:hypothetical protein